MERKIAPTRPANPISPLISASENDITNLWPKIKNVTPSTGNGYEFAIPNSKKTFSQEMLFALLESGFSKISIARELKISKVTVYQILNGVVQNPRYKTFSKIVCLYFARCYGK